MHQSTSATAADADLASSSIEDSRLTLRPLQIYHVGLIRTADLFLSWSSSTSPSHTRAHTHFLYPFTYCRQQLE